jgi:hypothetical protein
MMAPMCRWCARRATTYVLRRASVDAGSFLCGQCLARRTAAGAWLDDTVLVDDLDEEIGRAA